MSKIKTSIYPVLPLRDLVMFPKMITSLFIGRHSSIKALEAIGEDGKILLIAQKDPNNDSPKVDDMYKVGVLVKVLQVLKLQTNNTKILVEGCEKVKVLNYIMDKEYIQGEVKHFTDSQDYIAKEELAVLERSLKGVFEEYVRMHRRVSNDVLHNILEIKDPKSLTDAISSHIILSVEKKQKLLEITKLKKKFEQLLIFINAEMEFLNAEHKIKSRVKTQIEKSQRDYYLNEQLKAIHKELGEEDSKDELNELGKKIKKIKFSQEAMEKAQNELKKLRSMNAFSSEANVIRNYLDWLIDLPWQKISPIKKDLKNAQKVLDNDHYGLEKVKDRIIEYLAVGLRTSGAAGPIICLVGPPGVGKTSLARSIAKATGRAFVKVAVGGLRDEAEIKGHRRTYVGAMPGKIIQAMKKAGTSNPLILLDEIDKMGNDYRSDPAAAMLEVLDPEQNKTFNDNYLEVDYDLSKVMFITTANSTNLQKPLLDRLEVIRLSGYTEDEKLQITRNYLIGKQMSAHGLNKGECDISDSVILEIIRYYTRESGVRNLEREIAKIMRKSVKKIMVDSTDKVLISKDNISEFLGVQKYLYGEVKLNNRIGITNGLSYSEVGGDLLEIEAVILEGKGEIKITGKLGDVMKESVSTAISYIRSRAKDIDIPQNFFKEHDIHLHVPEGAVPKDGPSAGIAICTSITSAITGVAVKRDIAMTGEITLSGRVLGIGGLKEKLLAALRGGVKTVLIPIENEKDLYDIPQNVKDGMNIIPVTSADEVINLALVESFNHNDESELISPMSKKKTTKRGKKEGKVAEISVSH
jgi:ATP-dependent Lon protease